MDSRFEIRFSNEKPVVRMYGVYLKSLAMIEAYKALSKTEGVESDLEKYIEVELRNIFDGWEVK